MKRSVLVPVLGLAALALSTPVRAQSTEWLGSTRVSYAADERQPYNDARRAAYDNGYREGLKEGDKDGRKNDAFRYEDERTFQRADNGYHREFGELDRYRQSFRSGYAAGYSEAYQRHAPVYDSRGGYGNRRAVPRRDSARPPYYPDARTYPGPSPYPGVRGYTNAAFQNGVNDGYEKGMEDTRKNRSFDPLRHAWYRSGDRRYEDRFGSREQYKDVYRRGFQEGYDRGYREGRYR
jgi:flagellar biosynthesis/type III secretory pathway protein FliH